MRTPIHPGEILKDELNELNLSANQLAKVLSVPTNRITQILNKRRAITADTARRLGQFFGTTPQYWLNLQTIYELDLDRLETTKDAEINAIPRFDKDNQNCAEGH